MKKRLPVLLLMCLLLNIGMPAAQAASLEAQLADLAVRSAEVNATLQQLTQIKQVLESGDKEAVWSALVAAAVNKVQQDYNLPVFSGGTVQESVEQAARQALTQKMQEKIMESVAPYQDIVNTLGLLQQLQGNLNPSVNQQNNSLTGAPENYREVLDMTATAYAPGSADNGRWGDLTYVGTKVRQGVAAVDPQIIPMGTKLWVEGYGYAIAEDQGSAIKGNRIDLAFNELKTAQDYGIQNVKVYVLN